MRKTAIIIANVIIFWLLLPVALCKLGAVFDRLLGNSALPLPVRIFGAALALAGGVLCIDSIRLLLTRGGGWPISALPPERMVAVGSYRYFRHPLYAGYFYLLCGVGALIDSPGVAIATALLAVVWLNTWVRLYEEPALLRRYGSRYRRYRRNTNLLIPYKIFRSGAAKKEERNSLE